MLGRRRSGVAAGVGVDIFRPESESESLEILRLRSPVEHLGRHAGRRVDHEGMRGGAGNLKHNKVPKRYVPSEVAIYPVGKF